MTITKYGVDHKAVQKLMDSGEAQTEEEAIEKVAQAQLKELGTPQPARNRSQLANKDGTPQRAGARRTKIEEDPNGEG